MSRSNHMQQLIVQMKIGFNFYFVRQFISFSFSFFIFLCSYSKKGISRTVTVVYLQEFLVNDQERTSPMSQHGTKEANRLLRNSTVQAKKELTSMVSLNYSSSDASMRLILSSLSMNILRLLLDSTLYMVLLVPQMLDSRTCDIRAMLLVLVAIGFVANYHRIGYNLHTNPHYYCLQYYHTCIMKQPKSKLSYQQIEIPSPDAGPDTEDSVQYEHEQLVPTEPNKTTIPIPSKEILPNDDYKNYLLKRQFQYSESGSLIINSHNLKLLCVKEGLYEFPELNNKLYLHFKCIQRIQNLNEYVNLKTLYLENNVIKKIENLGCLPLLQNLFLQHNMIVDIENLDNNKKLLVLNLSYNNIFTISGLSQLPHLQNLTITNNYFQKFQSVAHLGECTSELTTIDLSGNRIVADPRLFDLVGQVKCLYLGGNPLVREMEHYRRNVIGRLKNLLYLDQRAVAEDERFLAEKWVQQGSEGLKKAKLQLEQKKIQRKQEEKKEMMKDINAYRKKKITIFQRSIEQLREQIAKLKEYQEDPSNVDMSYYYGSQIDEKQSKIREYEGYIESNLCMIEGREPPKRIQSMDSIEKKEQELAIEDNPQQKQLEVQTKETAPAPRVQGQIQKIEQVPLLLEPQKDSRKQLQKSTNKTNYSYDELD